MSASLPTRQMLAASVDSAQRIAEKSSGTPRVAAGHHVATHAPVVTAGVLQIHTRAAGPGDAPRAVHLTGRKSVSDFDAEGIPMTLSTPCRAPEHSRWHTISGVVVLLGSYVGSLMLARWWFF
jgi:hypothetical protein